MSARFLNLDVRRKVVFIGSLMFAALLASLVCRAQAPAVLRLTLRQAEDLALKNHPRVLAAQDLALASAEQVREARSAYYPQLSADVTGSQGNTDARIGAGSLAASRLFNRFGQGIVLSQLITDMGRTSNLVSSSRLQEQAAGQDALATRYETLLAVSQAYFNALQSRAVVKVAEETVTVRQQILDQVSSLAKHQLKSQLDVTFASTNLSDAKLMLIRAQDNLQQAYAELARAIGADQPAAFELTDEPLPPSAPTAAEGLVAEALKNRPELSSLRLSSQAAHHFADAEKDLSHPNVSLVGVAGFLPFINNDSVPPEYEGVAVNIEIPIFNGHLYAARREAARFQASAADQRSRDLQLRIARDVRVAWASAFTAYQRLDVAAQFVQQAKLSVELAQGRYDLGLASIVELTQAQLNLTRAEIEALAAKYDYQSQYVALQFSIGALR